MCSKGLDKTCLNFIKLALENQLGISAKPKGKII